jgi:hypothetical protein
MLAQQAALPIGQKLRALACPRNCALSGGVKVLSCRYGVVGRCPLRTPLGPASAGFFFQSNFREDMTNERTSAIRGAIIGGRGRTTPMEGFVADLVKTFESGKIDDPFGYDVQLSRLDEAAFTSGG